METTLYSVKTFLFSGIMEPLLSISKSLFIYLLCGVHDVYLGRVLWKIFYSEWKLL